MEKSKKPALRFDGFDGDWKEQQLKDVAADISDGDWIEADHIYSEGEYRIIQTGNLGVGKFLNKPSTAKYFWQKDFDEIRANEIFPNDLLISRLAEPAGRTIILPDVGSRMVTSVDVTVIRPSKTQFDSNFLMTQLNRDSTLHTVGQSVSGTSHKRISRRNLEKVKFYVPDVDEQTKIGELFKHLDGLIAHHQSKYDKLAQLKKAMLQKMFPQKGKLVPEIRFKGFSGEWEECEFGLAFENLSNNSLSRAELNYNEGSVKNVHYGDVLVRFGELLDVEAETLPYISDEKLASKCIQSSLRDGDVIIADAAEDFTVGKCTELVNVGNETVVSGLHTIAVRPTIIFASGYLGYYLNSSAYHNQLLPLMQGTKVLSLSKSAMKNTSIKYPTITDEQRKIGDYFKNLDKALTLHKQELEKLQHIKKACLEKMFV